MPAGLLPDDGIADQLTYILSSTISGVVSWQLLLWTNDYTPDIDTVLSDLTEATWMGYNRVQLDRSVWTTPLVQMGCATSTWGVSPIGFFNESGSPVTNYGCAYLDPSTGLLRFVQRFDDADIAPLQPGGQFQILPQYTLTSASCVSMAAARRRAKRRAKGEKSSG
jgi:hypothetical protein